MSATPPAEAPPIAAPAPSVEERTRAVLAHHVGAEIERVTDEALLLQDLGFDSLDYVEVAILLEDEFSVDLFDDDEIERAQTVGDVVRLVRGKVDACASAKAA